jgi:hypothetical protein
MNDRRILITCLVLVVTACLILGCAGIVGGGIYLWNANSFEDFTVSEEIIPTQEENQTQPADDVSVPEEDAPTQKVEKPEPTESNTNPGDEAPIESSGVEIDPDVARQMDEIQMQVVLDRGLKPSKEVNRILYTPEQLREKVKQDFEEEYSPEEAKVDALVLASFGLLEPDFDLYNFQIDLLSEQIAGFYDPKTGEMVTVQGEDFGVIERFTYAHEYTHALQDQNFDLENGVGINDENCDANSEACAAARALIEGDATLEQLNWFMNNASPQDQADMMESMGGMDTPIFDSAPEFITMDLLFPYDYGYQFAQHLYSIGGWGTVDRAFRELPSSTEQIMHPERYPDDQPQVIELPDFGDLLGEGWEELERGVMGEWSTYLILSKGLNEEARLDEASAALAVEGWGGDQYVVYYNADEDSNVMILQTTWDTSEDSDEFATALGDYLGGRFGPTGDNTWQNDEGYTTFYHEDSTVTWISAPDAKTLSDIWQVMAP